MRPTITGTIYPHACLSCGTAIPTSAAYCPGCGRRVAPLAACDSTLVGPRSDQPMSAEPPAPEKETSPQVAQAELPARYRILKLLGKGGMGVVFQAMDTTLERPVAIKLMAERYRTDVKAERRFLREARAQAIVNHPNVAQVLNAGVSPTGRPYIVMEYVKGRDLRDAMREQPDGFDPWHACILTEKILDGLEEAHAAGVVHRDLKPSNVMLLHDHRGDEQVKVLDLGLAKIIGGTSDLKTISVDTAGMLVGTPAYMSPEQVTGANVDARADLYAMGIVLYEMLTGRLPFESETLEGWLYQHLHEEPPKPTKFRPDLEQLPGLVKIVTWALKKSPHERPQTANEMMMALRKTRYLKTGGPAKGLKTIFEEQAPVVVEEEEEEETHVRRRRPDSRMVIRSVVLTDPPKMAPGQTVGDGQESPDPAELRRDRYLALSAAAIASESEGHWLEAIEHWQVALKYAEDKSTVNSQIDALKREIQFESILKTGRNYGTAGDWTRAEEALRQAATLRPADPRIEQTRARLPKQLIEAWLEGARTRLQEFAEGQPRQTFTCRLAVTRARMGDMPGAIGLLQAQDTSPDTRILGLAQAAMGALEAGQREGLRPYLERAYAAVKNLTSASSRGRCYLQLGRAYAAYGDSDTAADCLHLARTSLLEAGQHPSGAQASSRIVLDAKVPWDRTETTPVTRRTTRLVKPSPQSTRASALGDIAQTQAQAGLVDDALTTTGLIDDPWIRCQAMADVAESLARAGHVQEAERVAQLITFRLPKSHAMCSVAIAHIYAGDLETAEAMLRDMASPDERAVVEGYLAAGWARRGNQIQAQAYASDILRTSQDVASNSARMNALLKACEPLVETGNDGFAEPILAAAGRIIDGAENSGDKLLWLLRLAQVRQRPAAADLKSGSGMHPASPILLATLGRALGSLRMITSYQEREEALEWLGQAITECGACDLCDKLLSQAHNETERAWVYLGLSTGMA